MVSVAQYNYSASDNYFDIHTDGAVITPVAFCGMYLPFHANTSATFT